MTSTKDLEERIEKRIREVAKDFGIYQKASRGVVIYTTLDKAEWFERFIESIRKGD